jgi:beta-galactosidase
MFHGGTNFGFNAGADFRKAYMPDTTSYDYDSPLDEAGRLTSKFHAMREVIRRHLPAGTVLPEPPAPIGMITIPRFSFRESLPLSAASRPPVRSSSPLCMEELGQAHGPVLYRAKVAGAFKGTLRVDRPPDYAIVFSNGRRLGSLDRRLDQTSLAVDLAAGSILDILVDVMGHLNFGPRLVTDRKGIGAARLGDTAIGPWEIFPMPLDAPPARPYRASTTAGPAFHRTTVNLGVLGDTYLDMRGWNKGYVWVNGQNLGRYWNIGPQLAMFLPAGWLRQGRNEIVVLDLEPAPGTRSIQGVLNPIWK